ncbi:MAG: hypothetical protein GWO78_04570 [Dehalococcoidales bacterium]|mgnify:FL=1|nr:hypothetical protein [Dehalococcoidales bacterium]
MGIYKHLIFAITLFMLSDLAESRPVSWAGGSTIMYRTNSMMSSYLFHYSPTYKYSIGAEYVNDKYFNNHFINLRSTYLLDRHNTKISQRNIYLTGGISTKTNQDFSYGIHGDWETRRIFSSFSVINKHTKEKNYTENEFQLGLAPYLGEYNDIHTWVMLKAKKNTINNDWEIYPFIKLFQGDYLIEVGSKNSHWDIHFIIRY